MKCIPFPSEKGEIIYLEVSQEVGFDNFLAPKQKVEFAIYNSSQGRHHQVIEGDLVSEVGLPICPVMIKYPLFRPDPYLTPEEIKGRMDRYLLTQLYLSKSKLKHLHLVPIVVLKEEKALKFLWAEARLDYWDYQPAHRFQNFVRGFSNGRYDLIPRGARTMRASGFHYILASDVLTETKSSDAQPQKSQS